MKRRCLLYVAMAILLASFKASAGRFYDLDSPAQQLSVEIVKTVTATLHVNAGQPGSAYIDILYPREDMGDEWGDFQVKTAPTQFTTDPPYNNVQDIYLQWKRFGWDTSTWDFTFDRTLTVTMTWQGQRNQLLDGVVDDYVPEPGAVYTSYTRGIPEVPSLTSFGQMALANPIVGMVTGYVGVEQRGSAKIQEEMPGDCEFMTVRQVAFQRSLDIPTCFVAGINVSGSVTLPVAFGTYVNRTILEGEHCETGIWNDSEGRWISSDRANQTASGMEMLQFISFGYFEDESTYADHGWVIGGDVDISIDHSIDQAQVLDESQTYTWRYTRQSGEFADARVFCQKPGANYKGGILYEPTNPTVDVGNDYPGVPKRLVISPNPVKRGGRVYVEIGAPKEGTSAVLRLYDVTGKLVSGLDLNLSDVAGYFSKSIRLPESLTAGVYFAKLRLGTGDEAAWRVTVIK